MFVTLKNWDIWNPNSNNIPKLIMDFLQFLPKFCVKFKISAEIVALNFRSAPKILQKPKIWFFIKKIINNYLPVAQWTAECNSLSTALTSAPLLMRKLTIKQFPEITAKWSGVYPSSSASLRRLGSALMICSIQFRFLFSAQ